MPQKIDVSIDEVLGTRKDIADDDGHIYKAHVSPRSWNDAERSAVFVMSAETEDSYRDIVVQAGIDTASRFDANPVAFFGHRSYGFPIGSWSDIKRINGQPKRTEGKMTFTAAGIDEDADRCARHVKAGNVRAASIGFRPKKVEKILNENGDWNYGYRYLECELLECSVVSVPAVREALIKGAGTRMEDIVSPEVIEEFLTHLKANPALAKMINRDLYEGVYREITGNRTSLPGEAPEWLTEVRSIAERMEKASSPTFVVVEGPISDADLQRMKTAMAEARGVIEHAEPEIDEVAKDLEDSLETVLKDFAPKVDEIDEPARKGALQKILDGIRSVFKAAPEPEPETDPVVEPVKADAETKEALRKQFDEIAAKHQIAA